jgi:hypothetical protein
VDTEHAHEEVSALIEEVPPVAETSTMNQQTPDATQKAPAAAQDTTRNNGAASGLSNGMSTAPIPSYAQQQPPQPQKIPTYEQPLPNEYRESGVNRQEGAYQNTALNERSIRPSEMKDEG